VFSGVLGLLPSWCSQGFGVTVVLGSRAGLGLVWGLGEEDCASSVAVCV
jgi:hypothetical protein